VVPASKIGPFQDNQRAKIFIVGFIMMNNQRAIFLVKIFDKNMSEYSFLASISTNKRSRASERKIF
jgi:hypothetical protein